MSDWQPIETATKDGTWVALLLPEPVQDSDWPPYSVTTSRWIHEVRQRWVYTSDTTQELQDEDNSHWDCYENPSHWMPLIVEVPAGSLLKKGR